MNDRVKNLTVDLETPFRLAFREWAATMSGCQISHLSEPGPLLPIPDAGAERLAA